MSTRILVWNGTQFDTVDSDTVDGLHSTQLQGLNFQHCVAGATRPRHRGLTMFQCYDSDNTPENYGNVISLYGEGTRGGAGELFVGWSGGSTSTSGAHAGFYVRSLRDVDGSMWSDWARVYTTAYKPTANDVGALPINGGYLTGNIGYTGSNYTGRALMFHDGDANGVGVSLSAGGLTLIGGGESANTYVNNFPDGGSATTENAVVCADSTIIFRSGVQGGFDNNKKITIDNTGKLNLSPRGMSIPTTGGQWIDAKTQTNLLDFTGVTTGAYHPFIRSVMQSGNVGTLGAIAEKIGFFGYHSEQTTNATNAGAYLNIDSGIWQCHGGMTAGNSNGNLKRTTISTANPSGGANGDIWIKY